VKRRFENPTRFELTVNRLYSHNLFSPLYGRYVRSMDFAGVSTMLDFGSGSGTLARHLAKHLHGSGGRLVCMDPSRAWLEEAKRRLRKFTNVEYIQGDVFSLSDELEFDAASIHFVLHDIDEDQRQEVLVRLSDHLTSSAKLYVREPTKEGHGMRAAKVRDLFRVAGFQELECTESTSLAIGPVCTCVFVRKAAP